MTEKKAKKTGDVVATWIFWLMAALILIWASGGFYPFWALQSHNMRAAERHAEHILSEIIDKSRYRALELRAHTDDNGGLWVSAEVSTEADKAALIERIAETNPPVKVRYHIVIKP